LLDDEAAESVQNTLVLVGWQGQPVLAGGCQAAWFGRARGGTTAIRFRGMINLLVDSSVLALDASQPTGVARLAQA
jgi:hypothetical protein